MVQPFGGALSVTNTTERGNTYTLDELKALFDLAKGRGLTVHLDGARFAKQRKASHLIAVWRGEGRTIDKWQSAIAATEGNTLGEPKKVEICGAPGVHQEGFFKPNGKIVVIQGFRHGTDMMVSWSIAKEAREAFRDAENHFFKSLVCDPLTEAAN